MYAVSGLPLVQAGTPGYGTTTNLGKGAAMKAVVWNGPGQIDLEDVADARIEAPTDAVVRLTMSAICGTGHLLRHVLVTAGPGTPRSVTRPTRTARPRARRSSGDRSPPAR